MTHDPLCPCYRSNRMPTPEQCQCDLIAKVRNSERADIVQQIKVVPWSTESWQAHKERVAILSAIRDGA